MVTHHYNDNDSSAHLRIYIGVMKTVLIILPFSAVQFVTRKKIL